MVTLAPLEKSAITPGHPGSCTRGERHVAYRAHAKATKRRQANMSTAQRCGFFCQPSAQDEDGTG